jgi:16S rRNA (adenine(1408)-N(1))-methyltransferase
VAPTTRVRTDPFDLPRFLARPHRRVVVDLGCGDGRATARLAAAEPEALVVGIDANLDSAARAIRRAARAPEKGGLPNLAFVLAPAERIPEELTGRADEVRVELPWGSLLGGLLRAEGGVYAAVSRMLAPLGRVRIVLNARSLPDGLTRDVAADALERALASAGLVDVRVERTAIAPDTGWGKRLAGGRPLEVIVAEAHAPLR